jgi:spectinomycin phosphotransferase
VDVEDGFSDGGAASAGDSLRVWVQQDFGVEIATLTAVEHGADQASLLWRGVGADGASYAVKLSGGGTPAGLIVSVHLAEHGVAGVTRPLISRHGRPWSDRERRRLSVVPWVFETRALDGEMSPTHWRSYGALLAKVHATAVTDALAMSLPREDHTHDQVASAARTLDSSLRLTAEDPAAAGRTVDDLVRALAQEWCLAGNRVSTLLDQADRLGRIFKLKSRRVWSVTETLTSATC